MERVKEKLKTENSVQKEIANYLISHCKKEPAFMDKIMNEKKSLNECFEYIKSEARKQAIGNAAVIDRDTVFGWAVHYFDEENLEFKATSSKVAVVKEGSNIEEETNESKPRIVEATKQKKAKQIPVEQLSLF